MKRQKQPGAQEIVQAFHDIGLADTTIARLVHCSPGTIWRIRQGEESGRNISPRLQNIVRAIQENERLAGLQ